MALLNKDTKYIKLNQDGLYEIYPNKEARQLYKQAVSSNDIIFKYNEISEALYKEMSIKVEQLGITSDDYAKGQDHYFNLLKTKDEAVYNLVLNYFKLQDELCDYQNDLADEHGAKHDYPIMEKYYADVKNSIPNIIEKGYVLFIENQEISSEYQKAKELGIFGETEDC